MCESVRTSTWQAGGEGLNRIYMYSKSVPQLRFLGLQERAIARLRPIDKQKVRPSQSETLATRSRPSLRLWVDCAMVPQLGQKVLEAPRVDPPPEVHVISAAY